MKYRVAFFVSAIAGLTLVAGSSLANLVGASVAIYPRVSYQATGTSALTYTASNHLFSITALPLSVQFSSAEAARVITGGGSLNIRVLVDNSGNLIGGVPANGGTNDFILTGTVSRIVGGVTNTYTGVLLTGGVTGFGFQESGATDLYDFRFNPTGGALISFFSCGDIAVQVTSATSTFTGSFAVNFNGQAKGLAGLEDLTPPVITCPFDSISVTNVQCSVQGGQPGAYVTFPDPTATDNCGTNVLITCAPTNGSFFALAPATNMTSYTVICTAIDPSHNSNSCAFVVTVEDTLAPEFADNPVIDACESAPITLTTDPGLCSATFTFPKPTATDSCCTSAVPVGVSAIDDNGFIIPLTEFTSNSIVYETGHFPQSCLGSNVITSTASDGRGNSAQAQCAVLVFDTEPPSIVCSNNQTVACTNGPVFYVDPIAWDNCTNLAVSCTPPNGSFLGIGSYPVTCIAIDFCGGNSNSCSFTLNVVDTTPPVISCPTNITVDCSQSTDPSSTGTATATDDCDPAPSLSYSDAVSGTCPETISRTWTATDHSGNHSQCVQIITVTDTVAPTITFVPAGGALGCNPASLPTDASVKALVTATDNCTVSPTINVGHVDGGTACAPTRTFTITATDACGNVSNPQTVVYSWTADTAAPTISGVPAGGSLGCNPASLPTDASVKGLVSATDNCTASPTINVGHVDGGTACAPTRTFTIIAADACGNAATQTVAYSWTADIAAPTISGVPAGGSLGCNPASLPTDASVKSVVTATDNCGTPTINVGHVDGGTACAPTRTFTIIAADACGNAATQTVAYSWTADIAAPTISGVPAGGSLAGCNPTPPTDASIKALVSATDNCTTSPTISVGHVDGGTACAPTRTFTIIAADACGNAATQTVTYSWSADTTAPSITCPGPVTVSCASSVPPANVGSVTASDSCGPVTVTFVSDVISNQTCPNRYTITRTYKATNPCGLSATCTQIITVNDTTKPTITCPTNITVSALSLCTNSVAASNPTIASFLHGVTATDNCGGSATVTNNAPSTFPLGTNTVTFTATDSCGNSTTCQAKVIVVLMPVNCEPIQCVPFFCQHHFDGFGNCQFATFEGNLTLPNGDQPCDFRSPTGGTFVAVTVTIGTNSPVVVYCKNQNPCTVQSDGCGGEAWEYFGNNNYERAICRFTDNQCYNSLIDPNLPISSATKNTNCGSLSTVSIGATSTRFYYGFQQAKQPITIACDGLVLLSVSNNVASSPFPFSQSGKTIQCTFPERLVPGNVVKWYATGDPSKVSTNCLIYTQQTSATGNSTATYYNDGGSCEFQVPTSGLHFNSNDRSVCVTVMIGQPGVSSKVGCFTFCQPLNGIGNQDWQYGQCSSFQDEFSEESDDDWGYGNW